jgi:nicotinamidase-related amidase
MTTALLIIDVQQALCTGEHATFDAAGTIARINLVSARARAAGVPVVLVQHEEASGPFAHGSPGWALAQGLDVQPTDLRVRKTTPDSFHSTDLPALLQHLGVRRLVVCGMQTDFCVDTTTRRALAMGHPVTLVSDGHTTVDNGVLSAAQIAAHHNTTLSHIGSFGPRVTLVPAAHVQFAG